MEWGVVGDVVCIRYNMEELVTALDKVKIDANFDTTK